MNVIRTAGEMQNEALALRRAGRRIGLVPTMGYLHEGHLSLIRLARAQSDVAVVSIFVNPTQFGPNEDLGRYPRDFDRDERLCGQEGVDIIFYPAAEEMYAPDYSVYVVEEKLSRGLCGVSRPGHFRGVGTVVTKLFNLCQPDVAVFGEKDAQQLRIIRRLVRDLNLPVRIVSGPTVREPDGLAMSSRNALLSEMERKDAVCLRAALNLAERMYADGERDAGRIRQGMLALLSAAKTATVDYVELVDNETLEPVQQIVAPCLVALAVRFRATRLIDNTVVGAGISGS